MHLVTFTWVFATLLVFISASNEQYQTERKIVCYFNNTAVNRTGKDHFDISNIDPNLCTHLVYSYARLNIIGKVDESNPEVDVYPGSGYEKFNNLRSRNGKVKTFIAVGGPNVPSETFALVAGDPQRREIFVNSAVEFVRNYGFDGMSIDLTFPKDKSINQTYIENYVQLLKEVRARFNEHIMLMVTVNIDNYLIKQSYDINEMTKYLDVMNLMTFDLEFWKNHVDEIKYWKQQGVSLEKIALGTRAFDFNRNTNSVVNAMNCLIRDNGLGGAMLYTIDEDDFLGTSSPSGSKYPLLRALNDSNSDCRKDSYHPFSTEPSSSTSSTSSTSSGDSAATGSSPNSTPPNSGNSKSSSSSSFQAASISICAITLYCAFML